MLDPRAVLAKLALSESEIDVYLAVLNGVQAPRDIITSTGRSRPTVYYALSALDRRGLLTKTGLDNDNMYRVESLKRLKAMAVRKQRELDTLQDEVGDFVRQFQVRTAADHKPDVAYYEGVSAVKNAIMESVYCHSRRLDTIVPARNLFWQLDPDFLERYIDLRTTLGVKSRTVWSEPPPQEYRAGGDEARTMPAGLGERFRTTVLIYDDTVLHISSLTSGYALAVRSSEQRELMRELFGVVWSVSGKV